MSTHQPDSVQKPGSQMLDHTPGPQPLANAHTAINIQQNTAKPSPSQTSNSAQTTQKAPQRPDVPPTWQLIKRHATNARKEGMCCCCCSVFTSFIAVLLGTICGFMTSSLCCLCRCLNQTTLLGCLCFPFTMLYTWWIGVLTAIWSVVKYVFRYIEYERMMMNNCACSLGIGKVRLLDACNMCFGCCCGHGPEDALCDSCGDGKCGKFCEKDLLQEPRCKCCSYQED